MIQCTEGHLFCRTCTTSYTSSLLSSHSSKSPQIPCPDQSSCPSSIPRTQLTLCLPPTLLSLYDRLLQSHELEQANLEGLEECPFCEFKCVIEGGEERLFRCLRGECGVVSCRGCKKLDHLPKSCEGTPSSTLRVGF